MAAHKHRVDITRPIYVPVKLTSTVPTNAIEIGDLVALAVGFAVPAASWTWDTNEATTRAAFMAGYIGIANSRSRIGSTDTRDLMIEVITAGEFDMSLTASATLLAGTWLKVSKAAGNALVNTVETTATSADALAVLTKDMLAAGVVARARLCKTLPN